MDLSYIAEHFDAIDSRDGIINRLKDEFLVGGCNVWGVPAGAVNVIKNLRAGDYVLLMSGREQIRQGEWDGELPALCAVKLYPPIELPELSNALWGEAHFPYIFFFKTELLNLRWADVIQQLAYAQNYDLRGHFQSVADAKLSRYGGVEAYAAYIRTNYSKNASQLPDISAEEVAANAQTPEEAQTSLDEVRTANEAIKAKLKTQPQLTDEADRVIQQVSRVARSLAFKTDVKKIYNSRCAICGLGLKSPDGKPEVQSAHIYPKEMNGSDDVRNGISLCRIHHWAFDIGWIALSDQHTVIVRRDRRCC